MLRIAFTLQNYMEEALHINFINVYVSYAYLCIFLVCLLVAAGQQRSVPRSADVGVKYRSPMSAGWWLIGWLAHRMPHVSLNNAWRNKACISTASTFIGHISLWFFIEIDSMFVIFWKPPTWDVMAALFITQISYVTVAPFNCMGNFERSV